MHLPVTCKRLLTCSRKWDSPSDTFSAIPMALQPYWREGADPHVARCQFRAWQSSHGEPTILETGICPSCRSNDLAERGPQHGGGIAEPTGLGARDLSCG